MIAHVDAAVYGVLSLVYYCVSIDCESSKNLHFAFIAINTSPTVVHYYKRGVNEVSCEGVCVTTAEELMTSGAVCTLCAVR